jgi:hypothetical protein
VADGINDYNALSPEKFHRPKRVLRSFRAGMESGRWVARYPTDLTDTKRAELALPETTCNVDPNRHDPIDDQATRSQNVTFQTGSQSR